MKAVSLRGGTVLVVDDDQANLALMSRLLERDGYAVETARDGVAAIALLEQRRYELVLLDVMMPGLSGFDVCRRIKENPVTRLIPVVLMTGLQDRESRLTGITAGADEFLSKPLDSAELRARVRSLVSLKRYTDELDSAEQVILSLGKTIEARDRYTEGHCERLARYATRLGERLGLDHDDLVVLRQGGFLHDLGKIAIPDSVLLKPGPLTPAERAIVVRHTLVGDELCSQLNALRKVQPIVRFHHERLDGSGYPDGLRGDAIPLLAQILSVVDIFDALTTDRPYRRALAIERALETLTDEVRRGWRRPDLVAEFITLAGSNALTAEVAVPADPDGTASSPGRKLARN